MRKKKSFGINLFSIFTKNWLQFAEIFIDDLLEVCPLDHDLGCRNVIGTSSYLANTKSILFTDGWETSPFLFIFILFVYFEERFCKITKRTGVLRFSLTQRDISSEMNIFGVSKDIMYCRLLFLYPWLCSISRANVDLVDFL